MTFRQQSVVATLDRPWNAVPTGSSVIWLGQQTSDIAVYHNVLHGNGAASYQYNSAGVEVDGYNVVIDDNDIAGVSQGVQVFDSGPGTFNYNSFNIYSRNNIHDVSTAFELKLIWNGLPPNGDSSWFVGNVFRDNIIGELTGGPQWTLGISGAAFLFFGNASGTGNVDLNQVVMNIFDGNIVTGSSSGAVFDAPASPDAAIVDTVFVDNFFASAGSNESVRLDTSDDSDSTPDVVGIGNQWQNFDE